jgi:hypothetical protein
MSTRIVWIGRNIGVAIALMFLFMTNTNAGDVNVTWKPNHEEDLAGYKIYQGTASGNYTHSTDAGNVTSFTLTGLADNVQYFFTLTAYDTAGNESAYSAEISCTLGDQLAPTVVAATALTATQIQILFSEAVEPASAENAGNYTIDNGINIYKASLQSDRKTVLLTTSEHLSGKAYVVAISNVTDLALPANSIAAGSTFTYSFSASDHDVTPPTIASAHLISPTELTVYFSEPVDLASAANLNNYRITPSVQILSVTKGPSDNVIQMITAEHFRGTNYVLSVSNVTDASSRKNIIQSNSEYVYQYEPGDVVGPVITLVSVPDANRVEVLFNEPVEEKTARQAANYGINGGVQVLTADLDASGQIVKLNTSAHEADRLYLLKVSGVRDVSVNGNFIASNSAAAYTYEPVDRLGPTISRVEVRDASHLRVIYNEMVDQTTAENSRHYLVNNGVQVISAALDATGQAVVLETTPHLTDRVYQLSVSEVLDLSANIGNEILPNSSYAYVVGSGSSNLGPTIVETVVKSATSLLVEFSKSLDAASAQNSPNYTLSRDASVLSARLDSDKSKVLLETSSQEIDKLYVLTVSNVADENQNPILPNSTYSYVYEGADNVGPFVSLVKGIDAERIDVLFNERIVGEEAEKVSNYSISGGIQILSARLDGSHRVVHLQTSTHSSGKLYLLRVQGVTDESAQKNLVSAGNSYAYLFEPADNQAPTISAVRVKDSSHLQIVFSEPVKDQAAGDVLNYSLNYDLEIKAAAIGSANNIVELETSVLTSGKVFLLTVNSVQDVAGNVIAANSSFAFTYGESSSEAAAVVTDVVVSGATQVVVTFSSQVDPATAEQVNHYLINNGAVTISSADVDTSAFKVRLQTTGHEAGRIYMLMVNGVGRQDRPDLVTQSASPFFYLYEPYSSERPAVVGAEIIGETLIAVTFSQPMDRLSAENFHNYHISGEVTVLSAEMGSSEDKIFLGTSKHQAGLVYTLSISGVRSKSSSDETSVANGSFAYTYLPSLQVTVEGDAETATSYLDIGKEYYLDRNYVITQAPASLVRAQMIMTANNDKGSTESDFITVHLSQAAYIYIAYDSRVSAVPNWLDAKYSKSNLTLGVSDNAEQLDLWRGYFSAGKVTLGGNNAAGAKGAKSMYIILVQEPSYAEMPGGQLDEGGSSGSGLPEAVTLHPNYPNPFNPETTIAFDLPVEKQVRLIIYNILGRQVKVLYDGMATAGAHRILWKGLNDHDIPIAAGIYFCRFESWENGERNGFAYRQNYSSFTQKMMFLK